MTVLKNVAAALLVAIALPAGACAMNSKSATAPAPTLAEVAMASPDHTTLVAAVKAADLVDTLSGAGPLTVFAPTNAGFERLPDGTVATLLRPENRATLRSVLTYHVVAGRVTASDLAGKIRAGRGRAILTTVQGGTLTARMVGNGIVLTDARGGTANVVQADLAASNGIVHVTDAPSLP